MKSLGIVMAHGRVVAAVERHRPHWEAVCDKILYCCPVDDPLPRHLGVWQFAYGKSSAYSADTNVRFRESLRLASMLGAETTWVFEYDSVSFTGLVPQIEPGAGVSAAKFINADPRFLGKFYLHFPQIFSLEGLRKTVAAMDELPDNAELGFTDRYVGYAVEKAGIPVNDLLHSGWSFTMNHITASEISQARMAYHRGARMSHGIKDEFVFETLKRAVTEV